MRMLTGGVPVPTADVKWLQAAPPRLQFLRIAEPGCHMLMHTTRMTGACTCKNSCID